MSRDFDRLIGSWRLVYFRIDFDDASIAPAFPLGEDADGLIVYTREGFMSGQMMARGRRKFSVPRKSAFEKYAGATDEIVEAFNGYVAYFCRFELDPAQRMLRHHVICSLWPDWEGVTQTRYYALSGDELILRSPKLSLEGRGAQNELLWRRAPPTEPS